MARSQSVPCPECGTQVPPRAAGCPRCGHIFQRPAAEVSASSGGRSFGLACGGCLLALLVAGAAFWWIAGRALGRFAADLQRVTIEGDLLVLRRALERYADEHDGRYPDALAALLRDDDPRGPWLQRPRADPWGRDYGFEPPPEGARAAGRGRLYTLGRDGRPGGRGDDADLDEQALGLVRRAR